MEDGKMRNNLEKIINKYGEWEDFELEQLQEIINFKGFTIVERKRIIKKIVLEKGWGQDVSEEIIIKNIDNTKEIKYLLDRLFVEDIHVSAIEIFVRNVRNGKLNINKFLQEHNLYPTKHYLRLIQMPYII